MISFFLFDGLVSICVSDEVQWTFGWLVKIWYAKSSMILVNAQLLDNLHSIDDVDTVLEG